MIMPTAAEMGRRMAMNFPPPVLRSSPPSTRATSPRSPKARGLLCILLPPTKPSRPYRDVKAGLVRIEDAERAGEHHHVAPETVEVLDREQQGRSDDDPEEVVEPARSRHVDCAGLIEGPCDREGCPAGSHAAWVPPLASAVTSETAARLSRPSRSGPRRRTGTRRRTGPVLKPQTWTAELFATLRSPASDAAPPN